MTAPLSFRGNTLGEVFGLHNLNHRLTSANADGRHEMQKQGRKRTRQASAWPQLSHQQRRPIGVPPWAELAINPEAGSAGLKSQGLSGTLERL